MPIESYGRWLLMLFYPGWIVTRIEWFWIVVFYFIRHLSVDSTLALADDLNDNDVTMENNGIKIVMEKDVAAGFSDGSIDFVVDETGKNFIMQNAESGTCDNCEECDICDIE